VTVADGLITDDGDDGREHQYDEADRHRRTNGGKGLRMPRATVHERNGETRDDLAAQEAETSSASAHAGGYGSPLRTAAGRPRAPSREQSGMTTATDRMALSQIVDDLGTP
jgi:hypothetical protein